jgi:hypothetical protein
MFPKLLAVIVGLVLIGSAVLGLRRERIECWHAMAELHHDMDRSRKNIWAHQARITQHTRPDRLNSAISEVGLSMTPAAAVPDSALADDVPIDTPRVILLPEDTPQ